MTKNPYITPHNYYEQLNASSDKLKNNPEILELSKLCYETFHINETGKNLLNLLTERFLLGTIPASGLGDYGHECIRFESIRSVVRMFNEHIESHKQRIKAEVNKK